MPFCPSCRFEYAGPYSHCPDCGAQLVDTLPVCRVEHSHDEAELCTVTGEIHAKLLQEALASQGIPSRAKAKWPFDTPFSILQPPSVFGGGENTVLTVVVWRSDLARAQRVYADFELQSESPSAGEGRDTGA